MTTPLVDPSLAAFQASDPAAFLDGAPAPAPTPLHSRHDIERDLAVAVVVIAGLVVRELHQRQPSDLNDASDVVHGAWQKHLPMWLRLAAPAIQQAYVVGKVGGTAEEMRVLAEEYATGLGNYVGETSGDSVLEGLHRQLNQKWSFELAWRRAAGGYGLDRQQMNSYLTTAVATGETSPDLIPLAARTVVDRLLLARATRIGKDQAYTAEQTGRAMLWMRAYANGEIDGAVREWVIGEGEHHCTLCMSVAGQKVAPDEPFTIAGGALWAPRAHPGCTCHVRLVRNGSVIAKSGPIAAGLALRARDTGRVLMIQRALTPNDRAGGTWEFPGGHIDEGESAEDAAAREYAEEVRSKVPAGARYVNQWVDPSGRYVGILMEIANEALVPTHKRGRVANPDDPDGDQIEAIAWWSLDHMARNPALRSELRSSLRQFREAYGEVSKAAYDDPFDRDRRGRFSTHESRGSRVAVLDRPLDGPLMSLLDEVRAAPSLTAAPRSLTAQRSLTGGGSLTSSGSLTEQRSLTSIGPLTALTQRTEAPQRTAAPVRLRIRLTMPTAAAPPADDVPTRAGNFVQGGDVQDYYDLAWDGAIGFGGGVDFGEIHDWYANEYEHEYEGGYSQAIPAQHSDTLWGGMPPSVEGYSADEWEELMDHSLPIWQEARANAADLVDELDDSDLRAISERAFHGMQNSAATTRASIIASIDGDEEVGRGIGDSFADFITFARPDYLDELGIEGAAAFDRYLSMSPDIESVEGEPPVAFRIDQFAGRDDVHDVHEAYIIDTGEYVSALAEREAGRHTPRGHLNARVLTLKPQE